MPKDQGAIVKTLPFDSHPENFAMFHAFRTDLE